MTYKENLQKVIEEMSTALPEMSDVARDWCIEDVIKPIAVMSLKMQAEEVSKAMDDNWSKEQINKYLINFGLVPASEKTIYPGHHTGC